MEPMLPVKKCCELIDILSQNGIIDILIQTELNTSPFRYFLVILLQNDIEHLISKIGDSEVSIGTKDLCKSSLSLRAFVVKRGQSYF